MKNKRKIPWVYLSLLPLLACVFYVWGSSHWVSKDDYNRIISYDASTPAKDTLIAMTYNLGYLSGMTNNLPRERPVTLFESNLIRAKSMMGAASPDIIGFQEIDFDSHRSKNYNQLDSLGIYHTYHQGFASVNWDKRYVPFPYWPPSLHFGKMKSGQAILSKYPIDNIECVILERPNEAPFWYGAFYLDRLVQIADVKIGKTIVKVLNVHLEAFYPETRRRQADVVKNLFEKYSSKMPVILMGDFNSEPPWVEGADEVMEAILRSDHIESAIDQKQYDTAVQKSFTSSSGEPQKMIDFILYNDNFIEKIDARVVQEAGDISDHFPVVMRFKFKSKNEHIITE